MRALAYMATYIYMCVHPLSLSIYSLSLSLFSLSLSLSLSPLFSLSLYLLSSLSLSLSPLSLYLSDSIYIFLFFPCFFSLYLSLSISLFLFSLFSLSLYIFLFFPSFSLCFLLFTQMPPIFFCPLQPCPLRPEVHRLLHREEEVMPVALGQHSAKAVCSLGGTIAQRLRDRFPHTGFAPPEPEFGTEFCETNFGRPNFGPEFLRRSF